MRNVIGPQAAGAAGGHATGAARLRGYTASALAASCAALSVWPVACFPLRDLSDYTRGENAGAGGAGQPTGQPTLEPNSGGSGPAPPSSAGTSGEELPGKGTPLDPVAGMSGGSGNADPDPQCTGTCPMPEDPTNDAGSATVPDAELEPPPACAVNEATGPSGRCYITVAAQLPWDAARLDCQSHDAGWELASIRSAADSQFIRSLLDGEAWVGGSDTLTEGTWAWVSDGFEFWQGEGADGSALNGAFVNWFGDEPNGSDGSDCLRLLPDSAWADRECEEPLAYVCEGPPG